MVNNKAPQTEVLEIPQGPTAAQPETSILNFNTHQKSKHFM
jgi:hypothetical protein